MRWPLLPFEKSIQKVTYTEKIPKKKFLHDGAFPIISQESDFVNGYWDDDNAVFRVDDPVVVFGDHTKVIKHIDFDFVLGADGVKVLKPIKEINSRFFAYFLQSAPIGDLGYARHYRLLKHISVPVPTIPEQKRIVAILDQAFADIDQARALTEQNLKNARELFESYLQQMFSQRGEGWMIKTLSDVSENLDSKRVPITKRDRLEGDYPYYGASGIVDYIDSYIFDEDLLLVSEDGANLLARTYPIAFSATGKYWVNNHAHVLKFENQWIQKFTEYYLNSISLEPYVSGMAQPKLNQRALNSIPVPSVSSEIAQNVVLKLTKLELELNKIQVIYREKLQRLGALKKSLLQKAFSGQLTKPSETT